MVNGLPERLKELRQKHSFSQREVANRLNVSVSIISGYETGERTPSVENLVALSSLYNCRTDYLLGKETSLRRVIDVEGLSDAQIKLIIDLIDNIRKV